jgi:hypothetical protein
MRGFRVIAGLGVPSLVGLREFVELIQNQKSRLERRSSTPTFHG